MQTLEDEHRFIPMSFYCEFVKVNENFKHKLSPRIQMPLRPRILSEAINEEVENLKSSNVETCDILQRLAIL
jgi:hypothetical protein